MNLKDKAAVSAAIAEPWLNGRVAGQITKLMVFKRQMHRRGEIDRLEARVIGAA
jgi:transposase